MPTPDLMTVNEVASYLKVHPATIYRLLKRGALPAFRVGFDWRLKRTPSTNGCARRKGIRNRK
jgi:excisionase family DNA binding protein